jgi:hypothetical protein
VVTGVRDAFGISAYSEDRNSPLAITNSGDITVTAVDRFAIGILANTNGANGGSSPLNIVNSGDITAIAGGPYTLTYGISATTHGANGAITIENSGTIDPKVGILSFAFGANSPTTVDNKGSVEATYLGIFAGSGTAAIGSPVSVVNSGTVITTGGSAPFSVNKDGLTVVLTNGSIAVLAVTTAANGPVLVNNSGTVKGLGTYGVGLYAATFGDSSPVTINNSGSAYGSTLGIRAFSATSTTIVNSGDVTAKSFFAISVSGGQATIYNAGRITGFVALTYNGDTFINQKGGVFET